MIHRSISGVLSGLKEDLATIGRANLAAYEPKPFRDNDRCFRASGIEPDERTRWLSLSDIAAESGDHCEKSVSVTDDLG